MSELDRDLGAWAREELSREQLLAVHGAAAAALIAVHDRLTGTTERDSCGLKTIATTPLTMKSFTWLACLAESSSQLSTIVS